MGSIFISDFKFGMDRRRKRVAGTPGTLWTGENVVITRGGDIERAKKFVPTYALPAGQTFGLAELRGQLWTFGSIGNIVVPLGVNYQQLVAPSGALMTGVLDARASAGKLYVIAQFADGNIFHFYDGIRVTDWDAVAAGGFTYGVLADYFALLLSSDPDVQAASLNNTVIISARVPGTPFTISKNTQNRSTVGDQDILLTTTQANVPGQTEVLAASTIELLSGTSGTISSVKVNGTELLYSSVTMVPPQPEVPASVTVKLAAGSDGVIKGFNIDGIPLLSAAVSFTTNLTLTAAALAAAINANTTTTTYTAVAVGTTVTVSAPAGTGATPNGTPVGILYDGATLFVQVNGFPTTAPINSGSGLSVSGVLRGGSAFVPGTTIAEVLSLLQQSINNQSGTTGYIAQVIAGVGVKVFAPVGTGAAINGTPIVITASGNLLLTAAPFDGGITAGAGVAQVVTATFVGTPEPPDLFIITINGRNYTVVGQAASTGNSLLVASRRVFSTAGSLVVWSKLSDPSDWHTNSGQEDGTGNINVSNDAEGSERLVGLGIYLLNQMAAMTRRNIRLYNLSTDATQIGLVQPVDNSGALAPRSILNYGSIDLFYLADSGIRSLRPRDTTNTAFVDDLGTAIDTFVRAQIDTITPAQFGKAVTVMEPRDDRFWMAVNDTIYVLSYFPTSQISAWTYLKPGFSVDNFARVFDQLFVRSGDTIYQYGGVDSMQYPDAGELIATVELPFAAETPPGRAMVAGYDQAAEGEWQVWALPDPNNEQAELYVGTLDNITYGEEDISIPGRATHMAFRLTCSAAGYASLSNLSLSTDGKESNI